MPKQIRWSEAEHARLKEMASRGVSAMRAAVAMKRPVLAVKRKAREIGYPFPSEVDGKRARRAILDSTPNQPRVCGHYPLTHAAEDIEPWTS